MAAKYLLPCHCGQNVVVETRQAGETVACLCGTSLQAPTLLDILALDPAPVEAVPEASRSAWGLKQRLLLSGIVLVLSAIGFGILVYWNWPVSQFNIDPETIRNEANKLTPSQTWGLWEMMKQGLDRRTDVDYQAAVLRFRVWKIAAAALALVGVALIVAGTVSVRRRGSEVADRPSD